MAIAFTNRARRQFRRLSQEGREAVLEQLDTKPEELANMIIKIVGEEGLFRLRVRDWRVVFSYASDDILVERVGTRESIY